MKNRPLYVHYHIPKTAGTSLKECLDKWFGSGHLKKYHPVPEYQYTKDELDAMILENPEVRCLSSHSIGRYYPEIGGRPTRYFCFVRNPVRCFISGLSYTKLNYSSLSVEHQQTLPADTESISIKDLYSYWIKKIGPRCYSIFLSKFVKGELLEMQSMLSDFRFDSSYVDEVALALAISKVDAFSFVGLQEEFSQHLLAFANFLSAHGVDATVDDVPESNVSRHIADPINWAEERDAFGLTLKDRERVGMIFYNYCRAKWSLPPE